jgi:putative component of membrane protein insertase Oxa1/YidC/SpoIIIJ protein YidD
MKQTVFKRWMILALTVLVSACGHASKPDSPETGTPAADPFSAVIRFYQGPLDHLSAVRRGECPMHPSCSQFARQAIAAHGPLRGWVMAHDRLLRCGRDAELTAPRVLIRGKWKLFDPVAANDFW